MPALGLQFAFALQLPAYLMAQGRLFLTVGWQSQTSLNWED